MAKGLCSHSAKTFKSFFKSGSTRMLIGRIFFGALVMHTPYRYQKDSGKQKGVAINVLKWYALGVK